MNLNDTVQVKWTEVGLLTVEEHHRECLGSLAECYPVFEADCDKDGWSTLKLWHLMQILGPHVTMSRGAPLIEGNTIRLVSNPEDREQRHSRHNIRAASPDIA